MEKRFQVPIEAELKWYGVAVEMWVEVVLTSEGIIVDVYRNDDDDMADCMATGAHTWDELELAAPLTEEG
jgi:calcineurin-like phosphoesterase